MAPFDDHKAWRETLEAMEAVARGEVMDADEVHAWLRSWGDGEELPPPKTGRPYLA
jgi:predicted transcriptional regulator